MLKLASPSLTHRMYMILSNTCRKAYSCHLFLHPVIQLVGNLIQYRQNIISYACRLAPRGRNPIKRCILCTWSPLVNTYNSLFLSGVLQSLRPKAIFEKQDLPLSGPMPVKPTVFSLAFLKKVCGLVYSLQNSMLMLSSPSLTYR